MAKKCASYNQIKLSSDSDYVRVVFYIRTLFFFSVFWLLSFDVKIFMDESKTSKTPTFMIYWNVNLLD